ncbi:Undecaprenyl phosphate N,N'-diacetylbacillosamine 1-phosphate transferase [Kordia antarctica]|uniref:Undecaprenyl phosphate N,N'-diacetylbacillosamine 1-phosphate transferase n=1 Tax=Kordia antarctica TaxID=1218801 RepID=A0A7L4ZL57_9FLAO|nr:Undecaprenyl phosphate N,N'-diacetylbacillosamine 1-phosphate transferase [Kordia antarctica]
MIYGSIIKPIADFVAAFIMLLVLSPVFIIICIILGINNGGSPFFFQSRGGKNQKIFYVIKFKTMNDKKDEKGELLPDDVRLTKVGNFIRKTSLDELPQLINVLKGEMSLVGPRPFMSEYLKIYNDFQKRRHEVRPGITGWAQVNGRNNISWQRKFELDVWYVDNRNILLDIKILFLTLLKIIVPKDVNKEGETTTVKFNGKN